ncbi:MAG: glycosyltransferase family 2 protein [Actinobacteria bacterium]|nr:glycosyltransferase family 2 protein [Actinomycetota bacterium]
MHQAVERHLEKLKPIGGELLVADGSTEGLPDDIPVAVRMPGSDVFTLRAEAVKRARGEVIALTEDHIMPDPDWHTAVLRAHEENPDLAAVSGSTLNGSTSRVLDWANFLLTFAIFLPPMPARPTKRVPPAINVSLKRRFLEEFDLVPGRLELEIVPNTHHVGHMVLDDRVRVSHIQSHDLRETIATHFHNGRSSAALPFRRPPLMEILRRAARCVLLPGMLMAQTLSELRHKPGYRIITAKALPYMFLLLCAHATGEFAGVLFGPGTSPAMLE